VISSYRFSYILPESSATFQKFQKASKPLVISFLLVDFRGSFLPLLGQQIRLDYRSIYCHIPLTLVEETSYQLTGNGET
jgi:hypothetical protein